jgi:hypothetical protein
VKVMAVARLDEATHAALSQKNIRLASILVTYACESTSWAESCGRGSAYYV